MRLESAPAHYRLSDEDTEDAIVPGNGQVEVIWFIVAPLTVELNPSPIDLGMTGPARTVTATGNPSGGRYTWRVTHATIADFPVHVDAAKETIILERRTHIDSLVARLREDRVRRVIAPMLAGGTAQSDVLDDDFAYVVGLGLLRAHAGSGMPSRSSCDAAPSPKRARSTRWRGTSSTFGWRKGGW